ncbi:acyl-CoA dehydrogenase family protein [Streptosporangium sp. NPDC051022]|uniref:acyl-CoA dehydrogenase family protein n=1 Tax=Streptosporangium sp. NPDC051022 TaxID=3155752 RepID=UPI003449E6C4
MSENQVLAVIEKHAEELKSLSETNERLGRLSDRTAEILREAGVMKMLQPRRHGGLVSTPREFAEVVMRLGQLDGSTAWVAGVVGVHPWEMAFADPEVQEDIWGEDDNTWIASPYAPTGVLRPVDGGYVFNGRWQFSSGTDHCRWLFLGARLGDAEGTPVNPPVGYHVIIPRSDYTIVPDSWDVVGLRGTGSKDIVVENAFVPANRVLSTLKVLEGELARELGVEDPLFHVPFSAAFPLGITASVVGMAEGGLAEVQEQARKRVRVTGAHAVEDPHLLYSLGEAAAEIHAARAALLENATRLYDRVVAGEEITFQDRAHGRRIQVQAAWRAVGALDQVVARAGGNAMRMSSPVQRFWRDAHMGLTHAIHVTGTVMQASAMTDLGLNVPPGPLRFFI